MSNGSVMLVVRGLEPTEDSDGFLVLFCQCCILDMGPSFMKGVAYQIEDIGGRMGREEG